MQMRSLLASLVCAALYGCGSAAPPAQQPAVVAAITPATPAPAPVAPPPPPDVAREARALSSRLKRYEVPSQRLVAPAGKPSMVKGMAGTRVLVVPKDMVLPDGQPVTGDVDVELKEMPGIEQMLAQGTQTVYGRLLVTGGAIYVNMTSNGRQLSLKLGKTLKVSMPRSTNEAMKVFYGSKDSNGVMNWTATSQEFRPFDMDSSAFMFANMPTARPFASFDCYFGPRNDSMSRRNMAQLRKLEALASLFEEKPSAKDTVPARAKKALDRYEGLAGSIYNEVALQNFGWINCDRFLESQNLTTLACDFDPRDSISYAKLYLAFKDINSVIEERYAYDRGGTFRNVPSGTRGTVIAMAMRHGTLYTSRTDVETGRKRTVLLPMKRTADREVAALFKMEKRAK